MNREERIKALEAEVKDLRKLDEIERAEKRRSITPRISFTFIRCDAKERSWDRIREGSGVVAFHLKGELLNKAELESVGARTDVDGGMRYLVNMTDEKNPLLVMPYGGGRIWFGGFGDTPAERTQQEEIIKQLELFLRSNPNGGLVNHIIPQPKSSRW